MLDSIKVAIPITKNQHQRLYDAWVNNGAPQWGLFNPSEGTIDVARVHGLLEADQNSYHRQLRFGIPPKWESGAKLVLEFSVPKLWYGHNIHLLYAWINGLKLIKARIEEQCNLTRMKLPPVEEWRLYRVDACYSWRFPSQRMAQAYLDNLKGLSFPWKEPTVYKTSIVFPGTTYSAKIYLKHPEFVTHDLKVLKKQRASKAWREHLDSLAQGVLRFEITFRRRWLRERKILTVGRLQNNTAHIVWDEDSMEYLGMDLPYAFVAIAQNLGERGQELFNANYSAFKPGEVLSAKPGIYLMGLDNEIRKEFTLERKVGFRIYPDGVVMTLIREMLIKFIGEGKMLSDHQVLESLRAKYKENKAARLTAFWVFVQRFGLDKAKETFGKDSYYDARADLKNAGVDLIERPDNVVHLDDEFWHKFKLEAPSCYATNLHDDFRESGNILNLPKQA